MKLSKLFPEISGEYANTEVSGITSDSHKVKPGFAFVCIDGPVLDGHSFAKAALKNGAAVIIAEKNTGCPNEVIIKDTKSSFFDACSIWFNNPLEGIKLIGVTGTNGKTSVTFMIKKILEKQGYKCGIIGTINHMIGDKVIESDSINTTPGTYMLNELFAKMKENGCQYIIMEVSSAALDQNRICNVTFDVAIFTNLTRDHLDYHKTMEHYFLSKLKLFKMCKTAIINYDDSYSSRILEQIDCNKITYSVKSDNATYSAKGIAYYADRVIYDFVSYNIISKVKLSTGGQFSVYNSMCAIAAAVALGVSPQEASNALSELNGVKGRAEVVPINKDFNVIIDYAHTPDALQNILSTFKNVHKNRLIVLFGCGGNRDKTKRPIMGSVAAQMADFVIVTSDNPRDEKPEEIIKEIVAGMKGTKTPYVVIENRAEAIKYAIKFAKKDDIIILAGKGHETYQILKTGKIHFDEREVVKQALEEL